MLFRAIIRSRSLVPNKHGFRGLATLKEKSPSNMLGNIQEVARSVRGAAAKYAVELRPPTPAEIPAAIRALVKLTKERNWQHVTVRDAWRNTLVTTEVICWFFVGECIGKGTLIGYQV